MKCFLLLSYLKIGIVEAVVDVPAEVEELLPLEQNRVKEAQTEEELLVLVGLLAYVELGVGHLGVEALGVGLDALGRLGGDLDARLEDGDGKVGMGARAQPQAKVLVHRVGLQLLDNLVQLRHPAQRQVTVGQKYPVARLGALFDALGGRSRLTLTQRETIEARCHVALVSQLFKVLVRILFRFICVNFLL